MTGLRRRSALVAAALLLATTACDRRPDSSHATHAVVPDEYPDVTEGWRRRGRTVSEQLRDGDIAAVYAAATPELRESVTLADVDALFTDLTSAAPIGARVDERVVAISRERALYFADHRWGDERLRFTIMFDAAGMAPMVEPAPPAPDVVAAGTVRLRLPFRGTWWVSEGPTPLLGNHHAVASEQTHAYDFSVWRDGGTSRAGGRRNEDYWAWGLPVLAPAAGTVVEVVDGIRDNTPVIEADPQRAAGNHVIIDIGAQRYVLIAHFQRNSIQVGVGDRVEVGDQLGRTGNSGNSFEPHIHLHVQDTPTFEPGTGNGVAIDFGPHWADGARVEGGAASSGQFVEHAERP